MKKKFIFDALIFVLLGAASSLSLPPFNFVIINFFTFSVFFIFLFKKLNLHLNKKIFFFYGWLFGFGYFFTNLYWITISLTFDQDLNFLIPIALVLIPAFLSLFYGLITLIFYLFRFRNLISNFFLLSLLFGIIEFIRGNILTGFPWNLIIYSFSEYPTFISILSVLGTYSLNIVIISIFSAPAIIILRNYKKEVVVFVVLLTLPFISYFYGLTNKQKFLNSETNNNSYLVRIIGSNISLDRYYKNIKTDVVIEELIKLSSPNQNKETFFIWPEGIIPDVYLDELVLYSDLFKKNFNENHLIGLGITSRLLDKNKYFNSFSLLDNNLNLIYNYNKNDLVPFGEFLPFENYLNRIGFKTITNNFGSFTKGDKREIIEIENENGKLRFLPLICYEIIYSGQLTKNIDFDFILNISEDGWFGDSFGPNQHFVHSIFRAIETGKYVVRSSNNGMAAIINPIGEIEEKIEYGKAGFIDFEKTKDLETTLFSIYGNKIFLIIILLYIFLIFSFNRSRNE